MDIQGRADIRQLMDVFYDRVKADHFIGMYFNDSHQIDWAVLLESMTDFWDNGLFYTGNYEGNPMQSHILVHQHQHMTQAHFEHWNAMFETCIDDMFDGENSERLKQLARSISHVIQDKLFKPAV